jgi:hypothetical protein
MKDINITKKYIFPQLLNFMTDADKNYYLNTETLEKGYNGTTENPMTSMESKKFKTETFQFSNAQDNSISNNSCWYLHRVNILLIPRANWCLRLESPCIPVNGHFSYEKHQTNPMLGGYLFKSNAAAQKSIQS